MLNVTEAYMREKKGLAVTTPSALPVAVATNGAPEKPVEDHRSREVAHENAGAIAGLMMQAKGATKVRRG